VLRHLHITLLYLLGSWAIGATQDASYIARIDDEEKEFIRTQLQLKLWEGSDDLHFYEVPEEFQNEDAIYLKKTTNREFYRFSRNTLRTINLEHHVIKLLNLNGVEDNSVFRYEHIASDYAFDVTAVRVISPNGEIRFIDVRSMTSGKNQGLELKNFVIPGLQVGDILDFYYYIESRVIFPQQYSRIFDPVYLMPQEDYPILDYHLNFTLGPSAFMNSSSNQLPAFTEESVKIDRKTFTKFSLDLEDLSPEPQLAYHYPYIDLPSLKYQVFVGTYLGNSDIRYNIGGSLKMNTSIQPSRLQDYMAYTMEPAKAYNAYLNQFKRYLKAGGQKWKLLSELDRTRQYFIFDAMRARHDEILKDEARESRETFAGRAVYVLSRLKVPTDVVLCFDRKTSGKGNAVLTNEIYPLIRVASHDTSFFDLPTSNIAVGSLFPRFEAGEAYLYNPVNRRLSEIKMPISRSGDNFVHFDIELRPITGSDGLELKESMKAGGHSAVQIREQMVNRTHCFLEAATSHGANTLSALYPKSRTREKALGQLREYSISEEDRINTGLRKALNANGYNWESISLKILHEGMEQSGKLFEAEFNVRADDAIEIMDDRILLTLDQLLPEPILPVQMLRKRQHPAYFDYPESRTINLHMTIPSGYKIVEDVIIDKKIENETAFFDLETRVVNNEFIMKVTYGYNELIVPKDRLHELVLVLESYKDLIESKLLLQKQ